MRSQAMQDQVMPALARVRLVLDEIRLETQRTAAENDAMAAWYAKHGEQAAARSEHAEARSGPNLGWLRRRDVLSGLIHEYEYAA